LFGSILGTALVVISATIGATILMVAIKLALGEVVAQKIGARVKGMESNFKHNAFFYVLSMRFLPIVPFFLINLAAGIFNMKIIPFFIATLIGIIPGTFVYVNIGANLNVVFNQPGDSFSLSSVITPNIIIAFSLLALLSLLPTVVKKVRNKHANTKINK
ncbi:MAG TPA: VTT domain-containing protein, partial [Aquella sp.]|nr:VTT domain-containing protein [Aquella sp.]